MKKVYSATLFICVFAVSLLFFNSPLFAQSHVFYGTTDQGGEGIGNIIKFNPANNQDTVAWAFGNINTTDDGTFPANSLTYDPDNGLFYGMTHIDWNNDDSGTIISFNPVTKVEQVVWQFEGYPFDGSRPWGNLVYDTTNNVLYGMCSTGGNNAEGIIFSFNPLFNEENVLWSFGASPSDGEVPLGSLVYNANDGLYYGMTELGGSNSVEGGTIFSFDPTFNTENVVWNFGVSEYDGTLPLGSLTYDPNNKLFYGMTWKGGTNADPGVIFDFDPVSHTENVVWNFGDNQPDGAGPYGDLVFDATNNLFYGMTYDGGSNFDGAIISFNPSNNTENVVWSFNGYPSDGAQPKGNLVYNPDNGLFYGMTTAGGDGSDSEFPNGPGTIITFNPANNSENVVWNFGGNDGGDPEGSLLLYPPATSNAATVTTGTIDPLNYCAGSFAGVPFSISGTFNTGNIFTAQLSDASGSFTNPVNIGILPSTTSGSINTVIPVNTPGGAGYRIRVVSSNPTVTGSDNGSNMIITQAVTPLVSVTDSPGGPVCSGTTVVFSAHPTYGGTSPSYQWKYNGTNVGTNTPTYSRSGLSAFDSVWVVMTSSAICATSITVVSNSVGVTLKTGTTVSVNSISVCSGSSGTLTATGASTYTWAPATALNVTTGSSVTANPTVTTTYTVTGVSNCGTTTAKAVVTVNPAPSVATATAGSGATTTQITTNWNAASNATAYYLDVSLHNTFSTYVTGFNNLNVGNVTTYNVTGLLPATTYYYRIRANNACGTGSNSNTITYATTNCTALVAGTVSPASVIICPDTTQVLTVSGASGGTLQWQLSSDNATWENVFSGGNSTTYITRPIDGNNNKYYRCLSSNACYSASSATAIVDVSSPDITVSASAITGTGFTLNWSPAGAGNYAVGYAGSSTGIKTSVTPPLTLTGLLSNGTYNITVTQTSPTSCHATGTLSSISTLCAVPVGLHVTGTTASSITVGWSGAAGNYRIYYSQLFTASHVTLTMDVTNATSATISSLPAGAAYEIYIASLNCGSTAGQPSGYITGTTSITTTCVAPVIDSVKTTCSSQIQVWVHGSSTGQYKVYLQAISPVMQATNAYGISGGSFSVNVVAGQTFLVAATSVCSTSSSALSIFAQPVVVPPTCGALGNLLLSQPTCVGFTASWNANTCSTSTLSSYTLYLRKQGSISYASYGVLPTSTDKVVNWLAPNTTYQCFVRAAYSCGTYLVYGPASAIQAITTQSSGCRLDENDAPAAEPSVQQTATGDNEVFTLYPNPNSGQFIIDLSRLNTEDESVRIEVLNMLGQTILTQLTSISNGHLNEFINMPNGTSAGMYVVRVIAGKNIYTTKVNVSR